MEQLCHWGNNTVSKLHNHSMKLCAEDQLLLTLMKLRLNLKAPQHHFKPVLVPPEGSITNNEAEDEDVEE